MTPSYGVFQSVNTFIVYILEMADESEQQSASEEQVPSDENILSKYEEMFKHRYTDSDADYVKTSNAPSALPPCVENWYSRPKRSFDWSQRQDNRNRDYHGRHGNEGYGNRDQRDYNRDRDRYHSRDSRYGGSGDRSGESRHKYYRGDHGRGHHH